jgi:hypothetical protein
MKRLENKENKLKSSYGVLSRKEDGYKDVIPFTGGSIFARGYSGL